MVVTIIGGLELGHSLKIRMTATQTIDEAQPEATWDKPGWGGLPMRALHAARLLGFLTHPGARIETATVSGWKRLVTPAGQVFVRNTAGPVRLSLVPQAR